RGRRERVHALRPVHRSVSHRGHQSREVRRLAQPPGRGAGAERRAVGSRHGAAGFQEWLRLRDSLVGGRVANGNGRVGLRDRIRAKTAETSDKFAKSQFVESVLRPGSPFKKGYTDSPRNRSYVIMNNVLYHLHPVKVKRHGVKLSYTLCLGGLSFFLFILLTITGIFLMFYYAPTADRAYADVAALSTDVAFGT